MKKLLFTLFFTTLALADMHQAKLEPYETYNIKAAVSGLVTQVQTDAEGSYNSGDLLVGLDSRIDKIQLQAQKTALKEAKQQLAINKEVLQNNKQTMEKKKAYYERVKSLSTASKTEKDNAFYNYASAQNQYMATREKISSLKERIDTTAYNIANLEDMIEKKRFDSAGYVYDIAVKKGDYVNPGTHVITIQDTTKAKLTIYLGKEEVQNPKVFIEGKAHEGGFDRIWKTTDQTHISAYKAQIILEDFDRKFGEILQIEVQ